MNKSINCRVSIIITTYRNEIYLPRAIDSVLRQSYSNIEIIVVDDNNPESESRLATEKVMESYPEIIYLKHHKNMNGAVARNTGIAAATGTYIGFLDNDDLYFSSHVACCVDILEKNQNYGCVLCGVVKIGNGICWDIIQPPRGNFVKELFLTETTLGTGSNLFMRAEAAREINGFDEKFLRHQDVEFGIRLFSKYQVYSVQEIQIAKEMGGSSNAPDFTHFLETKQQLIHKFQKELDGFTEEEKKLFYTRHFGALLYVACKEYNKEHIEWTVSHIKKYRDLDRKEQLLVTLSKMHLFNIYEIIKKILKKARANTLYKIVKQNLTDEDLRILSLMRKGER